MMMMSLTRPPTAAPPRDKSLGGPGRTFSTLSTIIALQKYFFLTSLDRHSYTKRNSLQNTKLWKTWISHQLSSQNSSGQNGINHWFPQISLHLQPGRFLFTGILSLFAITTLFFFVFVFVSLCVFVFVRSCTLANWPQLQSAHSTSVARRVENSWQRVPVNFTTGKYTSFLFYFYHFENSFA